MSVIDTAAIEAAIDLAPPPAPARNRQTGERYANGIYTRWRVVNRCRELMAEGRFRPSVRRICTGGLTEKAVRYHFANLDELYEAALDDATRVLMLSRIMPNGPWPCASDCDRIVRAVVLGRLTQ